MSTHTFLLTTTTKETFRNSTNCIADEGSKACHYSKNAMGNRLLKGRKHTTTTFVDIEETTNTLYKRITHNLKALLVASVTRN